MNDLITKYASFLIAASGAVIGYLLRYLLERRSKQSDIDRSIYQQNRLEAINKFFSALSNARNLWYEVELLNLDAQKINLATAYEKVDFPINNLGTATIALKLYLDDSTWLIAQKMFKNTESIKRHIMDFYCSGHADKRETFFMIAHGVTETNEKLVDEFSSSIKKV